MPRNVLQAHLAYKAMDPADLTAQKLLSEFLGRRFQFSKTKGPRAGGHARVYVGPPGPSCEDCADLGTDGFAIHSKNGELAIFGNTPRARLYGVCHLVDQVPIRRVASSSWHVKQIPAFPIREWSTLALQGLGGVVLGGNFDRTLDELVTAAKRVIVKAPHYGVTAIQFPGRGGADGGEGGMGAAWLLRYRRYPELYDKVYSWLDHARRERVPAVRELGRFCHEHGVEFKVWNHEVLMSRHYQYLGEEIAKHGISSPVVCGVVRNKAEELFEEIPEIDAMTLTLSEVSGSNAIPLLHRQDVREGKPEVIAEMGNHIRRLIEAIWEACVKYDKGLQVRSYNMHPNQQEVMRLAIKDLPREIDIMTKYTYVDFRGVEYEDDPLLGAFPEHRQFVEFTCTPECNGFGYVPALLPDFFKERILRAQQWGLVGAVGRVDYVRQFGRRAFFTDGPPILTFDTPNEFNIEAYSRLIWDPQTDLDALWKEWSERRYGKELAPIAEKLLRQTKDITQGIFYVKGFHLLTNLDMPCGVREMDWEFGKDVGNWRAMFMPDDPEVQAAYELLVVPSEETIASCVADKDVVLKQARKALSTLRGLAPALQKNQAFPELTYGFHKLEIAAGFLKRVCEVYLRLRQARSRELQGAKAHRVLEASLRDLVSFLLKTEREIGLAWPLYGGHGGAPALDFTWGVLKDRSLLPVPVLVPVERLWLELVQPLKSSEAKDYVMGFTVPDAVKEIALDGKDWKVTTAEGLTEVLPGPVEVVSPVQLCGGENCLLTITPRGNKVRITKRPYGKDVR